MDNFERLEAYAMVPAEKRSMVTNTPREKVIAEINGIAEEERQKVLALKGEERKRAVVNAVASAKSGFFELADYFFKLNIDKLLKFDVSMLKELASLVYNRSRKVLLLRKAIYAISATGLISAGPSVIIGGFWLGSVGMSLAGLLISIVCLAWMFLSYVDEGVWWYRLDVLVDRLTGIKNDQVRFCQKYVKNFRLAADESSATGFFEEIQKQIQYQNSEEYKSSAWKTRHHY